MCDLSNSRYKRRKTCKPHQQICKICDHQNPANVIGEGFVHTSSSRKENGKDEKKTDYWLRNTPGTARRLRTSHYNDKAGYREL